MKSKKTFSGFTLKHWAKEFMSRANFKEIDFSDIKHEIQLSTYELKELKVLCKQIQLEK